MYLRTMVTLRTLSVIVSKHFSETNRILQKMIAVFKKPLFLVFPCFGQYHYKLKPIKKISWRYSSCRLFLRVKTIYQTLFVLNIAF